LKKYYLLYDKCADVEKEPQMEMLELADCPKRIDSPSTSYE
jgi:hypothetical protein